MSEAGEEAEKTVWLNLCRLLAVLDCESERGRLAKDIMKSLEVCTILSSS